MNSDKVNKNSKLAYFCGDSISYDLDIELKKEGFNIKKIINYSSEVINDLNNENKKLIENYPPDLIYIYSSRSAQSFLGIVKNYKLGPMQNPKFFYVICNDLHDAVYLWCRFINFNPVPRFPFRF